MVTIKRMYGITIGEHPEIELTEEEAQELAASLMASLAHTLEPGPVADTAEPPPFIPADATTKITAAP